MALVGIIHASVEPRGIASDAALEGGDGCVEIFGEIAGVVAIEFVLNDCGDLADLYGREGQADAVERIDRVAGVADDVPAIGGITLANAKSVIDVGADRLALISALVPEVAKEYERFKAVLL